MAFTYFFRDIQTLETAVRFFVPYTSGRSEIKIWNPGCASGQEPYSLAILLAENMGRFAFKNLHFYLTDIDTSKQFGKIIQKGIYDYNELQRIPKNLFNSYFTKVEENKYQIDYNIRKRMSYKIDDLTNFQPPANDFSMILCKNVLLHLEPIQRIQIMQMFYDCLLPDALLVTEQTQELPDSLTVFFEPIISNTHIYKKKVKVQSTI